METSNYLYEFCWIRFQLPSWSLTWNLKMMVSNRNLLFQWLIFRFHVKLQGCKEHFFCCFEFWPLLGSILFVESSWFLRIILLLWVINVFDPTRKKKINVATWEGERMRQSPRRVPNMDDKGEAKDPAFFFSGRKHKLLGGSGYWM